MNLTSKIESGDFSTSFGPKVHCIWGAIIGAAAGMAGTAGGATEVKGRQFTPDEQEIINRMEELSLGNEEIGQMYQDFSMKALSGDKSFNPNLEKDIADQESKLEGRISALGEEGSTAGIKSRQGLMQSSNIARDTSKDEMIQLGEQLMTARSARMTGAGQAALSPLARQRKDLFDAQLQTGANKASVEAGRAGLVGQAAGQVAGEKWG